MPDVTAADLLQAATPSTGVTANDLLSAASAPIQGGVSHGGPQPGNFPTPTFEQDDVQFQPIPGQSMPGPSADLGRHPNYTFQGLVNNAGRDAGNLALGFGALGSAAVRRIGDAITPTNLINQPLGRKLDPAKVAAESAATFATGGLNNVLMGNESLGTKPLFRLFGNKNESSDVPALVDATGNMLQDVAKNYIDPAMTGRFGDIAQHAYDHPVMTGLDAAAVLGPAKSVMQGGVGLARKIAPAAVDGNIEMAQALSGAAGNYAKQSAAGAVNAVGNAITSTPVGAALTGGVKSVVGKIQQWNAINKALYDTFAKHDKNFRKELKEQLEWVREAYKEIPKNISDEDLTNAVTMRDPGLYQQLIQGPGGEAIERFANRLNETNKWIAGRLISVGAMTEEEAKAATYGPYALKKLQEKTGNPNLPQSALTAADLAEAEAELEQFGVEPTYLGIIPRPVSNAVRSGAGTLFGGIGKTSKKFAESAAITDDANILKGRIEAESLPVPEFSPKVYYHGTNSHFDKFKVNPDGTNALGEAIYFSDAPDVAHDWAQYKWADQGMTGGPNIRPVNLAFKNALDTSAQLTEEEFVALANAAASEGSHRLMQELSKNTVKSGEQALDLIPDGIKAATLQKAGFDAVRHIVHDGSEEIAVFNPDQVRSVFEAPHDPSAPFTPSGTRPGFLTPREIGNFDPSKHEANPLHAFETRLTESLGFLHFFEALKDVMDNPKLAGAPGDAAVNFPLKANVTDLASKTGMAGVELHNALSQLPDVVRLPGKVAKELGRVMESEPNLLQKWVLDVPRRILTTTTLGLNPSWAVMQNIQNGLISSWSMFKGPNDVGRSLVAYVMAADKRASKVASDWVYDTHAERAVSTVPQGLAKLGAMANRVVDTVFGMASAGDNYFRVVKGLHSLMREIEHAEPGARVPLAKAFDLQARFDQIDKAATNPQYAAAAAKDIFNWFYDYGPQMADKWRVARAGAPYFLWWMHSIRLVSTAAIETPIKNDILARLAAAAPDSLQKGVDDFHKKMGMVPLYDREGNQLKGPNDGALMMGRSGFLPVMQPFELMKQGAQLLNGSVSMDEREGLPPVAPVITFLVGLAGRNAQNMAPWQDPRLIHTSGQQMTEDAEGTAKAMDPRPNAGQLAARSLAPTIESGVRDLSTRGITLPDGTTIDAAPSDFSNPLEAAPKRGSDDQPLKNFTPMQSAFYSVTKLKPTEVTRTQDDADTMKERQQKKYEYVRDHFQTERQKPVLTAIGKIIKGKK